MIYEVRKPSNVNGEQSKQHKQKAEVVLVITIGKNVSSIDSKKT